MEIVSKYQMYNRFGERYDKHTPKCHYQHDHAFLIREIRKNKLNARLLDIGCGSGFFLEKALEMGLDPIGIDPASAMLELAKKKVGKERLYLMAMQNLSFEKEFHAVTSLSWSLNYAANFLELRDVLERIKRALLPKGQVFLQIAHAPNAPRTYGDFYIDREQSLDGSQNITFKYRFLALDNETLLAQYQFKCHTTGDFFEEEHTLNVANINLVAEIMRDLGFQNIQLLDDYQGSPLSQSISPFLIAHLP